MLFLRVLTAELLKLRRTLVFWMVFVAPAVVLLLQFLIFHERSEFYAKTNKELWTPFLKNAFALWAVLMLPLYISLQTALLAALEHNDDRWRILLSHPVPRWMLYLVKLLIPCAMVSVSSALLSYGSLAMGVLLRFLKPVLLFPAPLPWEMALHYAVTPMGAALLLIALQHWISLRFTSFAASVGLGISGTIVGYIAANSAKYGQWWPWGLGIQFVVNKPGAAEHALWYSAIGATIVVVAGTIEFSRREMR